MRTYFYEIWMDGNCISTTEDSVEYFSEVEAEDEAMDDVYYIIANEEGYEDAEFDDFEIIVKKY